MISGIYGYSLALASVKAGRPSDPQANRGTRRSGVGRSPRLPRKLQICLGMSTTHHSWGLSEEGLTLDPIYLSLLLAVSRTKNISTLSAIFILRKRLCLVSYHFTIVILRPPSADLRHSLVALHSTGRPVRPIPAFEGRKAHQDALDLASGPSARICRIRVNKSFQPKWPKTVRAIFHFQNPSLISSSGQPQRRAAKRPRPLQEDGPFTRNSWGSGYSGSETGSGVSWHGGVRCADAPLARCHIRTLYGLGKPQIGSVPRGGRRSVRRSNQKQNTTQRPTLQQHGKSNMEGPRIASGTLLRG